MALEETSTISSLLTWYNAKSITSTLPDGVAYTHMDWNYLPDIMSVYTRASYSASKAT